MAAGVFAPGHLGELTRIVPFELADGVLADARATQRRLRTLPSRVGIYFVLAMCLFPGTGYLGVWAELTAALDGLGLAVSSPRALRNLRHRPRPASYQVAVQTAQMLVTGARNVVTGVTDLAGDIGRAVLASLHPPRRPRVCARRVKSPLSRWNKNPPGKPVTNLRVTKITTAIRRGHQPPATRRQRSLTHTAGP